MLAWLIQLSKLTSHLNKLYFADFDQISIYFCINLIQSERLKSVLLESFFSISTKMWSWILKWQNNKLGQMILWFHDLCVFTCVNNIKLRSVYVSFLVWSSSFRELLLANDIVISWHLFNTANTFLRKFRFVSVLSFLIGWNIYTSNQKTSVGQLYAKITLPIGYLTTYCSQKYKHFLADLNYTILKGSTLIGCCMSHGKFEPFRMLRKDDILVFLCCCWQFHVRVLWLNR